MERGVPGTHGRVLLAEDDRSVRDALVMALELEGYEVRATNDGEQALDVLDAFAPDVVVLDVMMPTVDGLTACRRLRARGIATPILMLTARDQVADRVSGLDAGADDYVVKPFSLDELLARLPRPAPSPPARGRRARARRGRPAPRPAPSRGAPRRP